MKKAFVSVALLVFMPMANSQQRVVLAFDQIFPPSMQQAMGLSKLTPGEKEVLRQHVESLLIIASTMSPDSANTSDEQPPKDTTRVADPSSAAKHWISKNIDNGEFILLEDNSLWQIDPLDKIDAMLWLPISNISIVESNTGSPGYDYLLINTDDGEKVHAKYIGKR